MQFETGDNTRVVWTWLEITSDCLKDFIFWLLRVFFLPGWLPLKARKYDLACFTHSYRGEIKDLSIFSSQQYKFDVNSSSLNWIWTWLADLITSMKTITLNPVKNSEGEWKRRIRVIEKGFILPISLTIWTLATKDKSKIWITQGCSMMFRKNSGRRTVKAVAARPLTSYLPNHKGRRIRQNEHCWWSKDKISIIDSYISVG